MANTRPGEPDPLSHVAARFSHALQMLADLIHRIDDPALDTIVQIACLEDWFTNYRLLIEFLIMKPPANCASAGDLASAWKPESSQVTARLKADFGWASEDVSHIGIPKPNKLIGNAHPVALQVKAEWIFELSEGLVAGMVECQSPYAELVKSGLARAKSRLSP